MAARGHGASHTSRRYRCGLWGTENTKYPRDHRKGKDQESKGDLVGPFLECYFKSLALQASNENATAVRCPIVLY